MQRRDVVETRVQRLVAGFQRFLSVYDSSVPFSAEQLALHRATVEARRSVASASAAAQDPRFVSDLRKTLVAWRMAQRGSRLLDEDHFSAALLRAAPLIEELEPFRIDDLHLPDDVDDEVWRAIEELGVVENDAKIVAGTKALHHLLPDLVPPMDRAWTGMFFSLHAPEWQGEAQRRTFLRMFRAFRRIATEVDLNAFVGSAPWRTSTSKLLDNAVIGFCLEELVSSPEVIREFRQERQLEFWVAGLPPTKNEAISLLGSGHPHRERVLALLASAAAAVEANPHVGHFGPGTRLALDVHVESVTGTAPSDATNYLGGIGDVLEDKARRAPSVDHLGPLAHVSVYANDAQIREVSYSEGVSSSGADRYRVVVRETEPIEPGRTGS